MAEGLGDIMQAFDEQSVPEDVLEAAGAGDVGAVTAWLDAAQRDVALKTFDVESARFPERKIVTEVLPLTIFYDAEDYHMQYLQKKGQSAKKNDAATIRCYG